MPRGKGIYEDEPREHRKTYSQDSADEPSQPREDPTPDDTSAENSSEPTG